MMRIAGGTVVTPAGRLDADVLVSGGKIAGLVSREVETGDQVVDATGKLVLPGMVDVHVHTREPGFTHKEDILTTTRQAAAGGVTTIFGMPNLDPPTTTAEALHDVLALYAATSIVDYNHNPAATLTDQVPKMAEMGIHAYKVYMVVDTGRTYPHPAGTGMHDHGDLLRMMDTIAATGKRFIVHPHDQALMDYIEGRYLDRGENTPQGYAQAYAEREGVIWDTAIDVVLRLAEASGCPVHLAHMQTRRSVDAVRRAKARGVDVTCEVNHWMPFLSRWEHVERLGPYALSYWVPDDARAAIWDGMRDGTIDIAASDHAPHTREEKEIGWTRMWSSHTGTPGIQYFYPLLLDAALSGRIPLERVVEMAAEAPAREFGLPAKGALLPGRDADIVIADPDAPWTITDAGVLSKVGWTPYAGVTCGVRIDRTFVRGVEVYGEGQVVGHPGHGHQA
ncbi:dihydroorotase family protein [Nonomuraea sp. NPDC050790]|uniref:dihydroorotase family protein n=1 Tax=Nonomuraea sp. NPDC050790 TaxID=3364371 RepID=UPI00378E191F